MQPSSAAFVDFQDVWLAYSAELLAQNRFAVEGINLQMRQGEFVAIVGPSGCGKSTFMKILSGEIDAQKGDVVRPRKLGVIEIDETCDRLLLSRPVPPACVP